MQRAEGPADCYERPRKSSTNWLWITSEIFKGLILSSPRPVNIPNKPLFFIYLKTS